MLFFIYSGCELSDEGRYLILYIFRGAEPRNKLYYCDLEKLNYKIENILKMEKVADDEFESSYDVRNQAICLLCLILNNYLAVVPIIASGTMGALWACALTKFFEMCSAPQK